jgi:hypothetical protein
MANLVLRGPFRLTSEVIRAFVPAGVAGVFVLGSVSPGGAHPIDAVGRADRDLVATLTDAVGSNSAFMFATAATAAEAFEMECALFHENMLIGRRPHPTAPSDTSLQCPVCGVSG